MFKTQKVVHKILLAFIFPTVILLAVTVTGLFSTYQHHREFADFQQFLIHGQQGSWLLYELQKERGYSTVFIASGQQLFSPEYKMQQKKTDEALAEFNRLKIPPDKHHSLGLDDKLSRLATSLSQIEVIRKKVESQAISSTESFELYSRINGTLIELTTSLFQAANDVKSVQLLNNLLNFIRAQESAGKERALISQVLASKVITLEKVNQILHYGENQRTSINGIFSAASQSQKKQYREAFPHSINNAVSITRELIASHYQLQILSSAMIQNNQQIELQLLRKAPSPTTESSIFNQSLKHGQQLQNLLKTIQQLAGDNEALAALITSTATSLANFTALQAANNRDTPIALTRLQSGLEQVIFAVETLNQSLLIQDTRQWFTISSNRIDALKKVEDLIFAQLYNISSANIADTRQTITLELAFLIILALFFALFYFVIIRRILSNFHELTTGLLNYSEGNLAIRLTAGNKDEFADISQAFNKMAEKTVSYIERIRKDKESLDNAVGERTLLLQQQTEEFAFQHWLSEGLTQLTAATINEPSSKSLFQKMITFLSEYLNSQVGLIYQANDNGLTYQAGYAVKEDANIQQSIAYSEGIIGQAATQRTPVRVSSTQELEFPRIETGFMTIIPRNFIVFPIVKNDRVIAVVALGSVYKMADKVSTFLDYAATYIATTIEVLASKEATTLLLEETQQQSRELAEKSKQITEFNEELKAANQHKSEFLASMSHELRTPLNSMLVLSELLAKNDGDHLTEKQVEKAQIINSAGKDLLRLINDILDVSKIEAGKLDVDKDLFDLHDLMQEIATTHSYAVREKQLALDLDLDAIKKCRIYSDAHRIKQIMHNFFSNAIKFTEHGSIKISGTIDDSREQPAAVITVTDTGIGISKENVNKMFQKFTQADSSISRRFGGTGLGLFISNKLANLLGADIKVKSSEGKGSAFSLVLPIEALSNLDARMPAQASETLPPPAAVPELKVVNSKALFNDEPTTLDFQPIPEKQVILAGSDAITVMHLKKAIKCFELTTAIKTNIPEALDSLSQSDDFHGAVIDVPLKKEQLSSYLTAVENVTDKPVVLIYPSQFHTEITKLDEQSNVFAFQRPLGHQELLTKIQEMLAG
ncbi:nitrate- and nitrite sensing domain-containing protein [Thalassomonas actiniarum]|uniref:histidine kinase n=1 Tax=Thalassomonas actiniarum TaxID=485447 RepID=A0AAF0BXK4_9GAMM|nr:nitrate- and nitrite sensing domain-containing protein [Thalassomonas actiniarum]WDD97101.1 nitrate- and nitrite sensing domain-containing protein [Thalassomonas actiniarum]